jgi:peptidoglycan hydrolase-like protein with peptidoglycan-binding domain
MTQGGGGLRTRGRPAPRKAQGNRDATLSPATGSVSSRLSPQHFALLRLQRLSGNRAVSRLVVQRNPLDKVGETLGGLGAAIKKALSPPLKKGDTGPAVVSLQKALNAVGSALTEDGDFGDRTKAAVAAFQLDHGLKPTRGPGTVDEATWDAIRAGGRATRSEAPGLGSSRSWRALSAQERTDYTTLGYTAQTWKDKKPPLAALLPFDWLSDAQRAAATRLGYTRESWKANRDATAQAAAKAYAEEESAAKKKAGAGVLPDKYVGSLRARAILAAEYGDVTKIELPKVHLLSSAEMKTAYEGIYGAGSYTPINGFTVKPDIYLDKSKVWSGTSVHESLHIQEHPDWDAFAYSPTSAFGEGATTILTERAMTKHGRALEQRAYPTQVALVSKMNTHAGLDKMKAAYFQGKTLDYRTAVATGLVAGTTWAAFRALVDAGALAAAQARLR